MNQSFFKRAVTGLLCAAMLFSSMSTAMVSYAAAAPNLETTATEEQPSVEPEQPSVEPEQPSVEPEQPSVEPEQPSVEPEQPSVEPEQPSVEPEQPSAEPEQPSVEPEQPSAEAEQPSAEPEQPSAEAEQPTAETEQPTAEAAVPVQGEFVYLSDLPVHSSKVGYGGLKINSSESGPDIHLQVDGEYTVFKKGLGAHATSTVIYDISAYSATLTHFVTYLGLDARRWDGGNGVKFTIYVSDDGQVWEERYQSGVMKGNKDAVYVDLDVTGKKFLKLYADSIDGNMDQDHAVYAEPRLKTEGYNPEVENKTPFRRVKEYDAELAARTPEDNLTNHRSTIYEREFVRRIGFYTLQRLYANEEYRAAVEYLRTNHRAMEYFIQGGPLIPAPGSTGENAMIAFAKIYQAHKAELDNPAEDHFHLRLAISVASAYSYPDNVRFWETPNKPEDPLKRYEAFVKLSEPGGHMDQAGSSGGNSKWSGAQFRALRIPLMRWVVDTRMNQDELFWLADYALATRQRLPNKNFLDAYTYINYKTFNYKDPKYYDEKNHAMWNEKYNIDKYFSDYGDDIRRQWILFAEGSVCGGLAKTYATLAEVFGRPSVVVGQPGHAATVTWEYDAGSQKYLWKIQNDVSGWSLSHSEFNNYLLGWGTSDYARVEQASYTLMASDALNDYDTYVKANELVRLAASYTGAKKVDLYEQVIAMQKCNLDAWEGLVTAKLQDTTLTGSDYLKLAKRITEELKYYPRAMEDLLLAVRNKITDPQQIAEFDLYRLTALLDAEKATTQQSTQPNVVIDIAKSLLKREGSRLASFSFDGEHAGAILLDEKYKDSSIHVRYSLDGGAHWIETDQHEIKLTEEQLRQLTVEHGIQVGLVGVTNTYTIALEHQKTPQEKGVYRNDWENLFAGPTEYLEYSVDDGATWQEYEGRIRSEVRFVGDQTVQLRYRRHGNAMASGISTYTFTADTNTPERTYLNLNQVKLVSFSTEQDKGGRAAANLIDGNAFTHWHSRYNFTDTQKEYVVEFARPYYISALEYLPHGPNGRWKNVQIYTSMDKNDWTLAAEVTLDNNEQLQNIPLNTEQPARYLKVKGLDSYGKSSGEANMYFSGKMLNFYVDTTKALYPPAEVTYSTTDKTNQDVVASIRLPEGGQMLEGEPAYTFTQNGTHTFRYQDAYQTQYEVTAEVTWIRKADLTGTITYSTTEPTQAPVVAEIGGFAYPDVYVSNNEQSTRYTFTQNGEFVFELADDYGNTGRVTATVQNIQAPEQPTPPTEPEQPSAPGESGTNGSHQNGQPSQNGASGTTGSAQNGASGTTGSTQNGQTQQSGKPGSNPTTGDATALLPLMAGVFGSAGLLWVLRRRRAEG